MANEILKVLREIKTLREVETALLIAPRISIYSRKAITTGKTEVMISRNIGVDLDGYLWDSEYLLIITKLGNSITTSKTGEGWNEDVTLIFERDYGIHGTRVRQKTESFNYQLGKIYQPFCFDPQIIANYEFRISIKNDLKEDIIGEVVVEGKVFPANMLENVISDVIIHHTTG